MDHSLEAEPSIASKRSRGTASSYGSAFSNDTRSTFTSASVFAPLSEPPLEIEKGHDDFDALSKTTTHTRRLWICLLCSFRPKFASLGDFKRHVTCVHVRYTHYCLIADCGWYSSRKDEIYEHLCSKHAAECMSIVLICSTETAPPEICPICGVSVDSWAGYSSCLAAHCCFPEGYDKGASLLEEEISSSPRHIPSSARYPGQKPVNPHVPPVPSRQSRGNAKYLCRIRSCGTHCSSRGTFKRHVEENHAPRCHYHCPFDCDWDGTNRKDKVQEHVQKKHQWAGILTAAQIESNSTRKAPPQRCGICENAVYSWGSYFDCVASHCWLDTHRSVDDNGGGGNGSGGSGNGPNNPYLQDYGSGEMWYNRLNPWETESTSDRDRHPHIWDGGIISPAVSGHTVPKIDNKKEEDEGHPIKRNKQERSAEQQSRPAQASASSNEGRYPPRLTAGSSLLAPSSTASSIRPPPSAASSLPVPQTTRLLNNTLSPNLAVKSSSRRAVLEPSYSLLDWEALKSNPKHNLRGANLPPNLIKVTPSMLKTQNGRNGNNAWTLYQGKVYNITPYLPYHPGGKGELLRGAGKDAEKLFFEVHPWVNWDAILGECLVGILVSENDSLNDTNALDATTNVDLDVSPQPSPDKVHSQVSQTTGKICPSSDAEDFSASISMRTDITIPECDADDSIDAGITQPNDLSCILDAANHYENLDQLELKTAQLCCIDGSLDLSWTQDGHSSLAGCTASLIRLQNAFYNLKVEGFCGSLMTVLVEDPSEPDVARAVQISLDGINSLVDSFLALPPSWYAREVPLSLGEPTLEPLMLITTYTRILPSVWKLPGEEYPLAASEVLLRELRFLCTVLRVGLLSFCGSHVCRFDKNITGHPMENIPVGLGYSFSLRKLACLDNFIGGPAWILGKSDLQSSNREMRVSLTVQDLQELWGPVWMLSDSPDEGPIIRTERGYVVPLPQQSPTTHGIECHWTKEFPLSLVSLEGLPQLGSASRILIGTDTTELGLTVNHKCQLDVSLIQQQIACQLQLPGASRARFIDDGFEFSLTGGQHIAAGVTKKWKRMPARTQRSALIELCKKTHTQLVPLLKLRVGLEVSACSRNAQRVTLWEALRLSQATANNSPGISHSKSSCEHKIGDMNCISSCWNRHRSADAIDNLDYFSAGNKVAEARRLIIDSILALEHTGVDGEGNMQAWWPFSDSPATCRIPPAATEESNNWFRVVKDTRDMSTFAVLSQRCLSTESVCVRGCSRSCKNGHMRAHRTGLYTRFLSTERDLARLGKGAKLLVGDVHLAVERPLALQTDQTAVVVAEVSRNSLLCKFEGLLADGGIAHARELVDYSIATDLVVQWLIY